MGTERTADDVFGLPADEIRLDVLRTVAEAEHENRTKGVAKLSFSDIYDRVDVGGTSKLSYHLGELTGTFLRKHEDGYAFTHAGEQMVRFILAENYRSHRTSTRSRRTVPACAVAKRASGRRFTTSTSCSSVRPVSDRASRTQSRPHKCGPTTALA